MNNLYFISEEHEALFAIVIDAYELTSERLKKKYRPQRLKNLNINKIRDVLDTYSPELIMTERGRRFGQKILEGLDNIVYIRSEYLSNELKGILERFTARRPVRERRVSKGKGHRVTIKKDENHDDSSVMFISEDLESSFIDIKKDFKVDKDVKDKNLIEEIEKLNVVEDACSASYFGSASKEEIRFTWDKPVEGFSLNTAKKQDKGKYGMFSRAERQVLEAIKTPNTTPSKSNGIDDDTSNRYAALPDIVINDEGNFTDFPQHMGEALPEIPTTPKRKPVDGRDALGTPSKRSRIDNGTSNGAATCPDIVINDEGNFDSFPQHMGEALPPVQTTPKRKPVDDKDIADTPSKRSRRSLNKEWGEVKTESLDDCWVLLDLEKSDNNVKKSKKKKNKKVFDEQKTIRLDVENIRTATVPIEATIINPRNILIPAEILLQIPSLIFAESKRPKPINRMLLRRFQNVVFHPPPPIERAVSKNNSELQPLVLDKASQLRAPPPNNDRMLSTVKVEPAEDLPPIEETKHELKMTAEPPASDIKVEVDTFPIEDLRPGEHITERPFNKTHLVDPSLPPTDSLGQYQDTVPIQEIEGDSIGVGDVGNPHDPDGPSDSNDPDWDSEYVYQRIKELCEGSAKITFRDLAPIAETKKMNRILAFEHILKLGTEEKICLEQSPETEIINIWLPEE